MITKLARVTILVRDYDEALRFYTEQLGFDKRADVTFAPGMRWLTVAPAQQHDMELVLQVPVASFHGAEQAQRMTERIGQQTTWVFQTDDCQAEYATLSGRGVIFTQSPKAEPYGVEAIFQDLYGNSYSLLEPAPMPAFGIVEVGEG